MEEVIQYVPNLYATFWALIPPLAMPKPMMNDEASSMG